MPNCGVGYYLDVVQIMVGVLRMYSSQVLKGYLLMIVLYIQRRGNLGNLKGKASVKFDLMMVLTVAILFLIVMIVLYP